MIGSSGPSLDLSKWDGEPTSEGNPLSRTQVNVGNIIVMGGCLEPPIFSSLRFCHGCDSHPGLGCVVDFCVIAPGGRVAANGLGDALGLGEAVVPGGNGQCGGVGGVLPRRQGSRNFGGAAGGGEGHLRGAAGAVLLSGGSGVGDPGADWPGDGALLVCQGGGHHQRGVGLCGA